MVQFQGVAHRAAEFVQKEQLMGATLWKKFVDVYRTQPDGDNQGWRGEYWGKMMRGAALVYEYTRDEALYDVMTAAIRDMMTVAAEDGRVSSYRREAEFGNWDMWSRKYVILASEYYLDVCKDEDLKKELIAFICRCADYIVDRIGPGKREITATSQAWHGVNSSSILEPMVRLYNLTGEKKYLDFAAHIVEAGGADNVNIFQLAYENKLYPYQYGVNKAYEIMSCFEGLLEYYKVTGEEKYKTAVINFAKAVLDSEVSIIGSCGITHELFDHTRTRQTVKYDGVMQETCVTVTWMKFCSRLLELTGDSIYADAMEKAFYNAYLGALNTERRESKFMVNTYTDRTIVSTFLPFDSYSPLTPGKRGQVVGGNQILPDGSYYGCCACIGAAGVGVFLKNAVTVDDEGITVNFYETGTAQVVYQGVNVTLTMETGYPVEGKVAVTVKAERPATFTLKLRNPGWASCPQGYTVYTKEWLEESLCLEWDMPLVFHYPEHWEEDVIYTDMSQCQGYECYTLPEQVKHEPQNDAYVAVTRGPLTLAADDRLGKAAASVYTATHNAVLEENVSLGDTACMLKLRFTPAQGEPFYLVDYASAGHDWVSDIAAWLPTA